MLMFLQLVSSNADCLKFAKYCFWGNYFVEENCFVGENYFAVIWT